MSEQFFTVDEFLQFAKSVETESWITLTQSKEFKFRVEPKGICLVPCTGEERFITYSEVVKFCSIFNRTRSFKTKDYANLFNKSYLLPLAKMYQPTSIINQIPEELTDSDRFIEGSVRKISVNAYERSPQARRACIQHHGTDCIVCGFNFAEVYGAYAEGVIHIHHLTPISALKGEKEVDPVTDLVPVCPNCHTVIHLRGECLSIIEMRSLIAKNA